MIKHKVKEHDKRKKIDNEEAQILIIYRCNEKKREKSLGDGECCHKEVVVVLFVLFCVDWSRTPTSIL